ncbi:MAG TPA: fused MFS/spermidine synthase [Archangium sp.]|jgi:spermidine synthase|uniref:spermidine synthase n=1 Tax=Archangium sp. TaxID=1872627 RepID=UPI002ED80F1C
MGSGTKPEVIHEAPSPFGTVFVVDEGDERSLRFDSPHGSRQSVFLKSDPLAVPLSYVRVAMAGLAFTQGRSRVLVVGLGGGTFPMLLHQLLPRVVVDVVEINPVVVEIARRFFSLRGNSRLRIAVEDGARFLGQEGPHYDLIFLDAFSEHGTPGHLKEFPFFEAARRRLAPGGVGVLNIAFEEPRGLAERIETFARAFEDCALLRGSSESNNTLGVGTLEPVPPEPLFWQQLKQLSRELGFPALTRSVVSFERATRRETSTREGHERAFPLLTGGREDPSSSDP